MSKNGLKLEKKMILQCILYYTYTSINILYDKFIINYVIVDRCVQSHIFKTYNQNALTICVADCTFI